MWRRALPVDEQADTSPVGYLMQFISDQGFQVAKKMFDTIVKLTHYDMPIPAQARKVKKSTLSDLDMFEALSDESLMGYFYDIVSQIGFNTCKKIFDTLDKLHRVNKVPKKAISHHSELGDHVAQLELADETLGGYVWQIICEIGFSAAKKIFDTIDRITGNDRLPIPPYHKRPQGDELLMADSESGVEFKEVLMKAFPHLQVYIQKHWNGAKGKMNWKEFFATAFPQFSDLIKM